MSMKKVFSQAISKTLSANDTGQTGGHQAGILVPKSQEILSFFPSLDSSDKNPRHHLMFYDESGIQWKFAFIYYNNRFFGGTRNEFRLTRMTPYIRQRNLIPGDELIFEMTNDGKRNIRYLRHTDKSVKEHGVLYLRTSGWKVIQI